VLADFGFRADGSARAFGLANENRVKPTARELPFPGKKQVAQRPANPQRIGALAFPRHDRETQAGKVYLAGIY